MIKFANKKDLPKNIETERNLINQYISRQIDLSNELISSIKNIKIGATKKCTLKYYLGGYSTDFIKSLNRKKGIK